MQSVLSAQAQRLATERCRIFRFDVSDAAHTRLPDRYTPKDWPQNKFSAELWLARALRHHPWAVDNASQADLVLMETNLSMACRAGKQFSGRAMWKHMSTSMGYKNQNQTLHPGMHGSESAVKAVILTHKECPPPWVGHGVPPGLSKMVDHGPGKFDIIAPFVLSKPPWLVGARNRSRPHHAARVHPRAPQQVPWTQRRLLFFAGHIPKLYIQTTRYNIWRQIRRHPGVTALSATLNCTVGSFSVCREGAGIKK
jgi:hypothetical protein